MKNVEIIEMLDNISKLVEAEKNAKAIDYIKQQKIKLQDEVDPASNYIDDLVSNLK